jgi:predicted transcriptional regulator
VHSIKVKDLMVPLADYATVSQEADLYQAVLALEEAQKKFDQSLYPHRAVLVYDSENRIIGKVGQLDVLRALEPGYREIGDIGMLSRFGFGPSFVKTISSEFELLQKPLDDICKKAAQIKVRDIMRTPTKGEYVHAEASLNEGVHQLAVGHHQSLLVTKDKEIVGILRLSDVFQEVSKMIKTCEL